MIDTLGLADPVDPARRRILQGALSMALGLTFPGDDDKLSVARKPLEARVHINQVGFLPSEPKRAVVPASDAIPGNGFAIVDAGSHQKVWYTSDLIAYDSPDGERYGHYPRHFFADFDRFSRPGRYRVRLSNGVLSAPFSIGADLYRNLAPLMLRYFDVQRCGVQGHTARIQCHLDDGIIDGGPKSGQRFDAGGGWHDAGDYLKFVETTSYVTALMLFSHECHIETKEPHDTSDTQPSLLQQARVGVEWLLKMHPAPQEFYYQVGDESDHNTWRLPEEDTPERTKDWKPRTVYFGVGANLAGRCAAAFAMASRLYRESDPQFAARCRRAAESVFSLGRANQAVLTTLPDSFYPEKSWEDDMEWGAVELFKATGSRAYLEQALQFAHRAGPADAETSVYNTHALAHYTLYRHAPRAERERILGYMQADARLIQDRAANPYGLGTPYVWGTAEAAAGGALTCLLYATLSKERAYCDLARRQRDFILGCNPFGLSCVIGAGTHYPRFPHHQIANIARMELTGAVVGGPTSASVYKAESIALDQANFQTMNTGPALSEDVDDEVAVYHDAVQDYVTNEPANDYTAKFLLLTGFYMGKC
jgi:endoglucanase